LSPQQYRLALAVVDAQAWSSATFTPFEGGIPAMRVGGPGPQQSTGPLAEPVIATKQARCADIESNGSVVPGSPAIIPGDGRGVVEQSPSCPWSSAPQQATAPLGNVTHVSSPAALRPLGWPYCPVGRMIGSAM